MGRGAASVGFLCLYRLSDLGSGCVEGKGSTGNARNA